MLSLVIASWIFQSSGKFSLWRPRFWRWGVAGRIAPAAPASRTGTAFIRQMEQPEEGWHSGKM
jgi:hypothetical protein